MSIEIFGIGVITSGDSSITLGNTALLVPVGNTAQRPSVSNQGMIRFNNETNVFESYDGEYWRGVLVGQESNIQVQFLSVAGGGGGGTGIYAGGGGAGGVMQGNAFFQLGQEITVIVGSGGVANQGHRVGGGDGIYRPFSFFGPAGQGNDTKIYPVLVRPSIPSQPSFYGQIQCIGGGAGGNRSYNPGTAYAVGAFGGSGGGQAAGNPLGNQLGGGQGLPGQGFPGSEPGPGSGGGGGGSSSNAYLSGIADTEHGGTGIYSSISGANVGYGGGGGGYSPIYSPGLAMPTSIFGGGYGGPTGAPTSFGRVNSGGGGGGTANGAGGSGIVIFRHPGAYANATIVGGGDMTIDVSGDKIYSFTGSGTITFNRDEPTTNSFQYTTIPLEYLVIGGGGGGGARIGGGGGGGGYLSSVVGELSGGNTIALATFSANFNINYMITIGAGGAGAAVPATARGSNGESSSFFTIIADGGGGGGSYAAGTGVAANGHIGGSGGGSSTWTAGAPRIGGTAISNEGTSGGSSVLRTPAATSVGGGGGGGALTAGRSGGLGFAGIGGDGIFSSITGIGTVRAGGGGAGGNLVSNVGGAGGGGNGGGGILPPNILNSLGLAGVVNTGGGGGGAGEYAATSNVGGNGGAGVVILRHPAAYLPAQQAHGANIYTANGYVIYEYNTSGNIIF